MLQYHTWLDPIDARLSTISTFLPLENINTRTAVVPNEVRAFGRKKYMRDASRVSQKKYNNSLPPRYFTYITDTDADSARLLECERRNRT